MSLLPPCAISAQPRRGLPKRWWPQRSGLGAGPRGTSHAAHWASRPPRLVPRHQAGPSPQAERAWAAGSLTRRANAGQAVIPSPAPPESQHGICAPVMGPAVLVPIRQGARFAVAVACVAISIVVATAPEPRGHVVCHIVVTATHAGGYDWTHARRADSVESYLRLEGISRVPKVEVRRPAIADRYK